MVYTDRTISLKQMKELAQQVLPSSTVVLFGSRARSDFSADSDYDFMAPGDKKFWERDDNTVCICDTGSYPRRFTTGLCSNA